MVPLVVLAAVAAIASTILGTVTDGTGLTRSIAAGRITRTVTSSRRIQFGLKYVFYAHSAAERRQSVAPGASPG